MRSPRQFGRLIGAGLLARCAVMFNRMMAATLIGLTELAAQAQAPDFQPQPGAPASVPTSPKPGRPAGKPAEAFGVSANQSPTSTNAAAASSPDISLEDLELNPVWTSTTTLRAGGGYRDNVYLSPLDPIGSSFASASAELVALRLSPVGADLSFFGSVDYLRFLNPDAAHNELVSFAQAKIDQAVGADCLLSLSAQYAYQDQIVDVSASETNLLATRILGNTVGGVPAAKFALPRELWLQVEAAVTRNFLDPPLDSYWQAGPRLTLGRSYGRYSEVTLAYGANWRAYDDDLALSATGEPIPGLARKRLENDLRLGWRHDWDAAGRWRTRFVLGGRLAHENGGGYFDYVRAFGSARVEYQLKHWQLSAEASAGYYNYDHRTVSTTDPALLRRTDVNVGVHVERDLYKRLRLVAGYDYERTLSNDPLEAYSVSTFSGSLQWEF